MSFNGSRAEYFLLLAVFGIGFVTGAQAADALNASWIATGLAGGILCIFLLQAHALLGNLSAKKREDAPASEEDSDPQNPG